jgi:hypothetical protein
MRPPRTPHAAPCLLPSLLLTHILCVHACTLQVLVGLNKRDPRCFDMYRLTISSGQLELDTENPGMYVHLALPGRRCIDSGLYDMIVVAWNTWTLRARWL